MLDEPHNASEEELIKAKDDAVVDVQRSIVYAVHRNMSWQTGMEAFWDGEAGAAGL